MCCGREEVQGFSSPAGDSNPDRDVSHRPCSNSSPQNPADSRHSNKGAGCMTEHISHANLNALADGELSNDQLAFVNDHLAGCPACTSAALVQTLLKSNVAKAGQRYAMPVGLEERLKRLATSDSTGRSRPAGRS